MRCKFFPQTLLEFLDADRGARFQLDLHDTFLRAAVPQINQVDRVARAVNADEAERDFNVIRADLRLDEVEDLQSDLLRSLDRGSGGSTQPHLKLTRIHFGKNFRAEPRTDQADDQTCADQIDSHDQPARAHNFLRHFSVVLLESRETSSRGLTVCRLLVPAQNPGRQNRHQGAR